MPKDRSGPLSKRQHGFTLVELLVVIGIIALLISILLPALSKARATANDLKCKTQIRTLIQGMQLHANGHRGYMPLTGLVQQGTAAAQVNDPRMQKYEYFVNGMTTNDALGMPGSVCKFLGHDLDTTSAAAVAKDLNSGIVARIMTCPSDKEQGQFGQTINDVPPSRSSYAFNEAALGWGEASDASGVTASHSRLRGNTAKFTHSAQLSMIIDANRRSGGTLWDLYYDHDANLTLKDLYNSNNDGFVSGPGQPGPDGDKSGKGCGSGTLFDKSRHHGRVNIGCADGHVESVIIMPDELKRFSINVDFGKN